LRLEVGKGIDKDVFSAVRMFRCYAEVGHIDGMFRYGYYLFEGRWIERNQKKAVRLFLLATKERIWRSSILCRNML
jgi:TPR repeat protein